MIEQMPRDLWRTIYDIQGEAQQAAEGDRACRSIEDTWARLEKVLPEPYRSAPDLLAALKAVCGDGEWITVEGKMRWCVSAAALERGAIAWTKAEGTEP